MRISYDAELRGRIVIDATGRAIGEVDALLVDTDGWKVSELRLKLRKDAAAEIRVPHGTFRAAHLEVPVALVQGVGDTVVLRVPLAGLRPEAQQETGPPVH